MTTTAELKKAWQRQRRTNILTVTLLTIGGGLIGYGLGSLAMLLGVA